MINKLVRTPHWASVRTAVRGTDQASRTPVRLFERHALEPKIRAVLDRLHVRHGTDACASHAGAARATAAAVSATGPPDTGALLRVVSAPRLRSLTSGRLTRLLHIYLGQVDFGSDQPRRDG